MYELKHVLIGPKVAGPLMSKAGAPPRGPLLCSEECLQAFAEVIPHGQPVFVPHDVRYIRLCLTAVGRETPASTSHFHRIPPDGKSTPRRLTPACSGLP